MTVCALCLFPRFFDAPACGICGSEDAFPAAGDLPEDFALRMAAEGRLDVAWASLEDKVSKGDATAGDCLHLAWLAVAFKDYRAVETWCHESERLNPGSPEPHIVLATVFERGERWPEAVEEYDAALRRAVALAPSRLALLQTRRDYCQRQIPEW